VRKRVLSILIGITLMLTMVFGLLPACSTPDTTPGAGGVVAPGEQYRWRFQTIQNAGTATYWQITELTDRIAKASGGRMIWDGQPQGAIVGTMEILDAVATGAIECGTSCD
jgi:TRAP-type mannitol/chloroaromatic compound transport system substrate-binding protein